MSSKGDNKSPQIGRQSTSGLDEHDWVVHNRSAMPTSNLLASSEPCHRLGGDPMAEKRRGRSALPHVALIVETSTAYGRAILSGISQYVREYGPWTVYIEQRSLQDPAPPWLERWKGDGIIARASTPKSARKLLKSGVPTVDLNDQVRGLGCRRFTAITRPSRG